MVDRVQGRGAAFNPGNRFEKLQIDDLSDEREYDEARRIETQYYVDASRSILARNDSPDVPFTFSVNPYRGCEHGCIYCYARPTHEYLGFSAGLDFESRILVKKNAPQLLEQALRDPAFEPQVIALSGNTDCYQPAENPQASRHLAIASGDVQCAATTVETWIVWNANGVATTQLFELDQGMARTGLVAKTGAEKSRT